MTRPKTDKARIQMVLSMMFSWPLANVIGGGAP